MDKQTSDRILNETYHRGKLEITIEGRGTCNVEGSGNESLKVLVDQVWCIGTRSAEFRFTKDDPWSLVSYDADASTLVVCPKK